MSGRPGRRRNRPEGRSSRATRRGILLGCFMLAGVMVLVKAAKLQVIEHEKWVSAAEDQHRERVELPARRGAIFDRKGVPLALSHETYLVSIAPHELRDPAAAAKQLASALRLPAGELNAATKSSRRWVVLPGRFTAEQRREVGRLRGVYFDAQYERYYPQGDAGREVTGAVTRDGRALGGIEQQFDDILRGQPGYSVLRREPGGELQASISLPVVPPTDGASVHLTIDFDLQEIADGALRDAIRTTGATGGDLMIADPATGEVLAAVSRRAGRSRSLTAITEPYEPGSTLKPFLAAALLAEERVALGDSVYAEEGTWRDGSRTFRDTSPHGWLTLDNALEVSSNIALVKFAKRLSNGEQYSYLRGFGLGTLTGIDYPAESSGWLRRPSEWSRLSSASLAMGYEISVTPLQMLAAYGALANGGALMEPYIVREVRSADGRALSRRTPRQIRQVVPRDVANAITEVLAAVVEEGTATRASLTTFAVAGKTGTSRRTSAGGGYVDGAYTSTFVGYFPAQDPRIVIFVKLDEPRGDYYGGLIAAPVNRETLQGILAARTRALDGRTLLASRAESPLSPARRSNRPFTPDATREGTYVFLIENGQPDVQPDDDRSAVSVPELTGLPLREAARRAHGVGLQVRIRGSGQVKRVEPGAGSSLTQGDALTLVGTGP